MYEYTDKENDQLIIADRSDPEQGAIANTSGLGVYVPRSEAQAIASAVAGEPVILIKESELQPLASWEAEVLANPARGEDAAWALKTAKEYLALARYLESEEAWNKTENEELDKLAEELFRARTDIDDASLSRGDAELRKGWRNVARKAKELLGE